MKKLTAGIFTVLLGLVAANSADAAVASKGYVDEMVGENTTAIEALGGTVAGHTQSIADLDAADTAINAKIGTVADGKTVVEMIEAAKTAATYDDTTVRGLIADKEDGSNKKNEIGEWSEVEEKQYFPSVFLTGQMIQSSTNEIGGLVADNAAAIKAINEGAVMNSGITADKVTAYEGYDARITANATAAANAQAAAAGAQAAAEAAQGAADAAQDAADANTAAIAAINNSENGLLKQAETAAKSYADSLATNYDAAGSAAQALTDAKDYADGLAGNYDAAGSATAAAATAKSEAITAANEYTDAEVKKVDDKLADYALKSTIGEVESGKTVVQMISDAETAATYDDTEVRGLIGTNKTATETNAAAINTINEGAVMNSGITADKVTAYNAYAGTIAENTAAAADAQADADAAQAAADAAQQTANNAIPKPSGECAKSTNKCVLTFNNAQYAWEVIERNEAGE